MTGWADSNTFLCIVAALLNVTAFFEHIIFNIRSSGTVKMQLS